MSFGTLHLRLDQTRQRLEEVRVGIVDMRAYRSARECEEKQNALVQWIVTDRLAVLTGHFGQNKQLVSDLAVKARAIHYEPLAQIVNGQERGE